MSPLAWSFVLSAVGILGIFVAGRKSRWGWAIGFGAQFLWVIFAITTGQYGFLLSAAGYGSVYAINYLKWHKEAKGKTDVRTES